MFGHLGFPELALVALMLGGSLVVVAYPASRICARAGFPRWLGLFAILPVLNVVLLWFVALSEWPRNGNADTGRPAIPGMYE